MKKHLIISSTILILIFIIIFFIAIAWGSYSISIPDVIKTLFGNGTKLQNTTIWDIRLPRIAIAIVVAFCLAISGSVLQSITKNQLAEPGMIGINAGAALFVVLLISSNQTNYYSSIGNFTLFIIPIVSILGAILSGTFIFLLSNKKGVSPTRLILIGIGVNIGINAFISLYQLNMSQGDYNQVLTWTSGSLWGSSWKFFWLIIPFVTIILIIILFKIKKLDVLNINDEIAVGLGINVKSERKILFFCAVILAGLSTAVAGNISFLGLLGPHIAKLICGPLHRRQLPLAAIINSIIIIFADSISRNLFSPIEIPVGITISIVGVPYLIYLMMKK